MTHFLNWVYPRFAVPAMSAYRQDIEPDRLKRLQETYRMAQSLCAVALRDRMPSDAIKHMRDHKGTLLIRFASEDWQRELHRFFEIAWQAMNENPDDVECFSDEHAFLDAAGLNAHPTHAVQNGEA